MDDGAMTSQTVHATCVDLQCGTCSGGVLLLGESGSGKSAVALKLLSRTAKSLADAARIDSRLVSDDQVILTRQGTDIVASAPEGLAQLLEVRGVGIVRVGRFKPASTLMFIVEHSAAGDVERLPEPASRRVLDVEMDLYLCDLSAEDAAEKILTMAQLHWSLISSGRVDT